MSIWNAPKDEQLEKQRDELYRQYNELANKIQDLQSELGIVKEKLKENREADSKQKMAALNEHFGLTLEIGQRYFISKENYSHHIDGFGLDPDSFARCCGIWMDSMVLFRSGTQRWIVISAEYLKDIRTEHDVLYS